MSRQHQRISVPSTSDQQYLQGSKTGTLPTPHNFKNAPPSPQDTNYHLKCTGSIRGNPCPLEHDVCFTDEAFTEHNYYDYYDQDDHGYQTSPNKYKDSRTEYTQSDGSDSVVMIPYYEYDDTSRRQSRHYSERASLARQPSIVEGRARVYPSDVDRLPDRFAPAMAADPHTAGGVGTTASFVRRAHGRTFSRMSTRSVDEAPSAVVHGCGGKCQTLENVCYYFLQVAFTMGILIGISLAIAGWVLRKSAARNLQVLLYIGAMLSLVCALLLRIQCSARKNARLKRRILRGGKRAHIAMEMLPTRDAALPLPLPPEADHRGVQVTLVQLPSDTGPVLQVQRTYDAHPAQAHAAVDQQGIPWWRRKDMV